jgi:phosphoglycolate phosphatase-like HAD superfamily hydrolase
VSSRPLATVDLDGVLADVRHRLHHLQVRPKNWDGFFADAPRDPLLAEGRAVVEKLAGEHEIVYLTGRPERCRQDTADWLTQQNLPEGRLLMRRNSDRRPSRVMKLEAVEGLTRNATVALCVDDDVSVVRALRRAGFTVLHADWMAEQPSLFAAQEGEGRT